MLVGLINNGVTFQRAVDIALYGLINNLVVIYLDDVAVLSNNRGESPNQFLSDLW